MELMQFLVLFLPMVVIAMDKKQELYKQAINLLKYVEFVMADKNQYKTIRKQILDLANSILRMDD